MPQKNHLGILSFYEIMSLVNFDIFSRMKFEN